MEVFADAGSAVSKPAYICSHGCEYSEFEIEAGMTFATMDALMTQEILDYDLEHDRAREQELARIHALGDSECPWPWYADAPIEIAAPEIFNL